MTEYIHNFIENYYKYKLIKMVQHLHIKSECYVFLYCFAYDHVFKEFDNFIIRSSFNIPSYQILSDTSYI